MPSSTAQRPPALRTYDVDALFHQDIQAALRLYYDPATESNGTDLNHLTVYHCDGAGWTQIPGPYTTGLEGGLAFVEAPGVSAFSPFALAQTAPLAVTVASFDATPFPDRVHLAWETASELNNAGFNLYRNTAPALPNQPLAFVPSQAAGSAQGAVYSYEDAGVVAGQTYWYWLADVDLGGGITLHGPVSVTLTGPTAVVLTGLKATPGSRSQAPTDLLAGWVLALAGAVAWRRRRLRSR